MNSDEEKFGGLLSPGADHIERIKNKVKFEIDVLVSQQPGGYIPKIEGMTAPNTLFGIATRAPDVQVGKPSQLQRAINRVAANNTLQASYLIDPSEIHPSNPSAIAFFLESLK